jgi:hypothetical protein
MARFKTGDEVVVTKVTTSKNDFNKVGFVGTVIDRLGRGALLLVDFGPYGKKIISPYRLEHYTEPTDKMEVGKRYRQNSTGSEAICVGHDQGSCVVRDLNRYGSYKYFLRQGKIGNGKTEWVEIGEVKRIRRKVDLSNRDNLMLHRDGGPLSNVEYTFEGGKLINVEMINN